MEHERYPAWSSQPTGSDTPIRWRARLNDVIILDMVVPTGCRKPATKLLCGAGACALLAAVMAAGFLACVRTYRIGVAAPEGADSSLAAPGAMLAEALAATARSEGLYRLLATATTGSSAAVRPGRTGESGTMRILTIPTVAPQGRDSVALAVRMADMETGEIVYAERRVVSVTATRADYERIAHGVWSGFARRLSELSPGAPHR